MGERVFLSSFDANSSPQLSLAEYSTSQENIEIVCKDHIVNRCCEMFEVGWLLMQHSSSIIVLMRLKQAIRTKPQYQYIPERLRTYTWYTLIMHIYCLCISKTAFMYVVSN